MLKTCERWIRGWLAAEPTHRLIRNWSLLDAEERSREWRTFQIPSRKSRESLVTGEMVKLVFVPVVGPPERMWVLVKEVNGDAHGVWYRGVLRNQPVVPGLPTHGSRIAFGPEHVIGIGRRLVDGG